MAKAKFLLLLTRKGSSLKSFTSNSSSKKDVAATTAAASNESDTAKSRKEVLMLLNNFTESESESDRELSFSFLLSNNSSPEKEKEKDDVLEKGGKTEDQCKEVAAPKEKKQRKISRSSCKSERIGVLLNLPVPFSFIRSRSGRETPCTTLAELEKREEEFNRVGCWPTLLQRKHDRNKLQLAVLPQLTC